MTFKANGVGYCDFCTNPNFLLLREGPKPVTMPTMGIGPEHIGPVVGICERCYDGARMKEALFAEAKCQEEGERHWEEAMSERDHPPCEWVAVWYPHGTAWVHKCGYEDHTGDDQPYCPSCDNSWEVPMHEHNSDCDEDCDGIPF